MIEFSNRLLAGTVIVLTLLLAYRGWRHPKKRLALAIAIGTFAQGPLGGITILVDLHPIAVASHFLLAIIVFTLATVLLVDTRFPAARRGRPCRLAAARRRWCSWRSAWR